MKKNILSIAIAIITTISSINCMQVLTPQASPAVSPRHATATQPMNHSEKIDPQELQDLQILIAKLESDPDCKLKNLLAILVINSQLAPTNTPNKSPKNK